MPLEKIKSCWEYLNAFYGKEVCTEQRRKKCPAFKVGETDDCWFFMPPECHKVAGIKHCWDCPWFKKNNPHFFDKKLGD